MNPFLLTAAALTLFVAVAHSCLGERNILAPILATPDLPGIRGSQMYTRQVLRAAWHLVTVFLGGMVLLLLQYSHHREHTANTHHTIFHVSLAFFAAGILLGWVTRGRHFAWILFLVIGGLALAGSW